MFKKIMFTVSISLGLSVFGASAMQEHPYPKMTHDSFTENVKYGQQEHEGGLIYCGPGHTWRPFKCVATGGGRAPRK